MKKLNFHQKQNNLFVRFKKDIYFLNKKTPPRVNYFIKNLTLTIEENMVCENFSIFKLCQMIGISRSQLHNKIKAATGISTSHFIRRIRLQKAKNLLLTTDLSVSEIAYQVGYQSPSYFSNCYYKTYNIRPSQVSKNKPLGNTNLINPFFS